MEQLSAFDRGVLVGVLIGEGSFGGDGKQPQITLRMHVRHEALFRWLVGAGAPDAVSAQAPSGPWRSAVTGAQWASRVSPTHLESLP